MMPCLPGAMPGPDSCGCRQIGASHDAVVGSALRSVQLQLSADKSEAMGLPIRGCAVVVGTFVCWLLWAPVASRAKLVRHGRS